MIILSHNATTAYNFFKSFGDVKIVNLKRTQFYYTAIKFLWQQQEAPKECYESTN